jgi:hypothetical protein
MKQRQLVTAICLSVALTGLSPMVAADTAGTSEVKSIHRVPRHAATTVRNELSPEQMDKIHAGSLIDFDFCLGLCSRPITVCEPHPGTGACTW